MRKLRIDLGSYLSAGQKYLVVEGLHDLECSYVLSREIKRRSLPDR